MTEQLKPAYVEFVFRVHANGRREQVARTYAKDRRGRVREVRGALGGEVREFTLEALEEVAEVREPHRSARRVEIDPRDLEWGRGRRRR